MGYGTNGWLSVGLSFLVVLWVGRVKSDSEVRTTPLPVGVTTMNRLGGDRTSG